MRGNRTAAALFPRPQTGFEDRPGHQAHAFRSPRYILVHVFPNGSGGAGPPPPPRGRAPPRGSGTPTRPRGASGWGSGGGAGAGGGRPPPPRPRGFFLSSLPR